MWKGKELLSQLTLLSSKTLSRISQSLYLIQPSAAHGSDRWRRGWTSLGAGASGDEPTTVGERFLSRSSVLLSGGCKRQRPLLELPATMADRSVADRVDLGFSSIEGFFVSLHCGSAQVLPTFWRFGSWT